MVGINDGPKFIGPVELVHHHKVHINFVVVCVVVVAATADYLFINTKVYSSIPGQIKL